MNTKMRTVFSLVIVLFVMSTLTTTTSDAQDFSRWGLPEGAEARLGKGIIESIAYSPDGHRIAVGASTGIWIYDVATGKELSLLGAHTGVITSIAYSRDGRMLASAHNGYGAYKNTEYYVALWNAATGTLIKTLSHTRNRHPRPFPISSIAFSPDATRIAVADREGGLLWNVVTGTLISTLDNNREIYRSITFSPDGRTIASGHIEGAPLVLWDGITGAFKKALHPTDRQMRNIAYSPDGTILACATADGRVVLWDVAASLPIDTFVVFEGHSSNYVAYSPDSKTIAVGATKKVSIWDAATGKRRHSLSGHTGFGITSIAYSPDSRTVASGGDDGTVRFWDAATGALKHTITGHTNEVNAVAFSPDGDTLAVGGAYSVNTVGLWDVGTSTLKNSLEIDTTDLGWFSVDSLVYSPDGSTIAGGNVRDGYLWDAATHKIRHRTEWAAVPGGIAYSSDGSTIASSHGPIALSPDGTKLVTQGPGLPGSTEAWISDGATGAIIKSLSPVEPFGLDTIAIWDVSTRRIIDKLTLASEDSHISPLYYDIAYSPDGNTVAAAVSTSVYLWDATTGRLRYRLTEDTHDGHHYRVSSVTFSPDSTTLASGGGSSDRTVRLWDVKTGILKSVLKGHSNHVVSLMFSPDGTTLASGSHDGTVLLWKAIPSATTTRRAPVFTEGDSTIRTVTENTAAGVNINRPVAATDADNDALTYTLSGPDAAAFSLDPATGQLRTHAALDYETQSTYIVAITVSDGIFTNTITVTINVADINEIASPEPERIAADVDGNGKVNIQDLVLVASSFGQRGENAADVNGDREVNISDMVLVAAAFNNTATTASAETPETTNNVPVFTEGDSTTRTVAENTAAGVNIGTPVAATDADSDTLTYTLGGTDASSFSIDRTGQLKTRGALDYETKSTYTVTITVSDGSLTDTTTVTINITNVDETPVTDGIVTGAVVDSGRTPQVQDAIVTAAGVGSVAEVTAAHLSAIEQLDLNNKGITALKTDDFDGLTSLTGLNLGGNDFNTLLLQDIFDKLTSLTVLILPDNDSTTQLIRNFGGQVFSLGGPNELPGTMFLFKVPSPRTVAGAVGDVNLDGIVNIQDLILVMSSLGETGDNIADTNDDSVVDIADLVNVIGSFGQASNAAPSILSQALTGLTAAEVEELLTHALKLDLTNPMVQQWIAALEHHLATLIPKETALLPNYPNPFNPETWIPYQLANPADVTVHIYGINGTLVRTLSLGHQDAGMYRSRSRAVYWDGKNKLGESVASGVYFYTLTTDDFTATRKMLIRK